jgi:glycosyltransferase involved in cell wall biosynthesis
LVRAQIKVCFPFVGDSIGGSFISTALLIKNLGSDPRLKISVLLHKVGPCSKWLDDQGINYVFIGKIDFFSGGKNRIDRALKIIRIQKIIRSYVRQNNFDIVHTNDGRMHYTWVLGCWGTPCQHIWHQRTRFSNSWLDRVLIRLSSRVIIISEFVRGSLPLSFQKSATLIENPLENQADRGSRVDEDGPELCRWIGKKGQDNWGIGFVGALNKQKRVYDFLKIAKEMTASPGCKCKYLIIGKDGDYKHRELQEWVNKNHLSDVVLILGYQKEIKCWYSTLEILVAPSVDEAFGRNIIEAQASGIVVVAASSGGHPGLIKQDITGLLVQPGDISAYASAIKQLISDKEAMGKIKVSGKTEALQRYDQAKIAEAICAIYLSTD